MSYDLSLAPDRFASRGGSGWHHCPRRTGALIVCTVLALVGLTGGRPASPTGARAGVAALAKIDSGIDRSAGKAVSVIVQAFPGSTGKASSAVRAQKGTVGAALPVIDGFLATIGGGMLAAVAASPAVKAITANRQGQFKQIGAEPTTMASEFATSSGAWTAWSHGNLGDGIGVAVIDTGVGPIDDLSGRIVWGPDFSGEGTSADGFGHGTVMAGLIGGNGADSASQQTGAYTGVAPRATVVAVKVAGADGAVDASTMLAAMSWVDDNRARFNIRVLNLSWGTLSSQDMTTDPLDAAVERLWLDGIVVVVAAGNAGPTPGSITRPADDPMVLTVGAYDDRSPTADSVAAWSSRGPTAAGVTKPDLVAPGRTLIATRAPGSGVEAGNPAALISPSYIKASGTSEATAVTSGLAALILAAHPSYTPDQVKAALTSTASPIAGFGANDQGAGRVRVDAALDADPGPSYWQLPSAASPWSHEAAPQGLRGAPTCAGVPLALGPLDVMCGSPVPAFRTGVPWKGSSWTGSSWTGSSWTGSSWTGSSWTGSSWTGSSWTGSSWTGSSWTGSSWTGSSWTGSSWTGSSWTGSSWTGSSWTGSSWTGSSWTGSSWTGSSWTGSSWTGSSWTGSSWTGSSWTGSSWTSAGYDKAGLLTAFWGDGA